MREDIGLSASWVSASAAYSALALAAGHPDEAHAATGPADAARNAFSGRYWDAKNNFYIAGFTESGAPITDERAHPDLLDGGLFTADRDDAVLDRLASSG